MVTGQALCLLYAGGYQSLALLLSPLAITLLWRLNRDSMRGAELRWRQGIWTLEQQGVQKVIVLSKRSSALPWVIYLAFTDLSLGSGRHIWLFVDEAARQQWRRLRVRLTLSG